MNKLIVTIMIFCNLSLAMEKEVSIDTFTVTSYLKNDCVGRNNAKSAEDIYYGLFGINSPPQEEKKKLIMQIRAILSKKKVPHLIANKPYRYYYESQEQLEPVKNSINNKNKRKSNIINKPSAQKNNKKIHIWETENAIKNWTMPHANEEQIKKIEKLDRFEIDNVYYSKSN